jgi:hypothetical protein
MTNSCVFNPQMTPIFADGKNLRESVKSADRLILSQPEMLPTLPAIRLCKPETRFYKPVMLHLKPVMLHYKFEERLCRFGKRRFKQEMLQV